MKYLILTVVLALCACQGEVTSYQIDRFTEQCKDRGGIYEIDTFLGIHARCNDGKWSEKF